MEEKPSGLLAEVVLNGVGPAELKPAGWELPTIPAIAEPKAEAVGGTVAALFLFKSTEPKLLV